MKLNFTKVAIALSFILSIGLNATSQVHYKQMMYDPSFNFYDVCDAAELFFETHDKGKGSGWKPYQRWKAENESKYYPTGDRLNSVPNFAMVQYNQFKAQEAAKSERASYATGWNELGPFSANNITEGYNPGIGRVESFWVNPTNTDHLFLGSRSGGFWKSLDGGATWVNTTDSLVASGVNTIGVNPFDSDTILINIQNGGNYVSHGIYQSVDGGDTWLLSNFNPANLGWGGLGTSDRIFYIKYHPRVRNLVFVGTDKGIYRSDDHLQTWTRLLNTADITDIEFHPVDDSIMYAYDDYYWSNYEDQVMRSEDQGLSYTASNGISGNGGSRGYIAVSPIAPDYVYFASSQGVWKSSDKGVNFTFISNPVESCYGFSVSDLDTSDMLYGYLNLMGSTDGGQNFVETAAWANSNPTDDYTHADLRTAECVNGVFYVGTDGYLAKTDNNGATWSRLNDGTGIREFYASGVSQSHFNVYMAGSQDNGTSVLNENGWIEWNGGDGMEAIVQTLNPNWMIGSWQYGTRQITKDGGQSRQGASNPDAGSGEADWQAPLLYSPNHQMRVYHFSDKVYQSDEFGDNWLEIGNPGIGILKAAAIAENNDNIMVVVRGSSIMLTEDHWVTKRPISSGLPGNSITDVAFDPNRDSTIIVTYNRYQSDSKKVYISHDLGLSWTNISYNLVDMPIRSVVIDHSDNSYIYLGAELGVYVMPMNGTQWELYNTNLPNVTVKDLEIQYGSNTLKAATWGRGLWEFTLKGRADYPSILETKLSNAPSSTRPRAGYDENVTAVISYSQNLTSVFVKWANDSIDLYKTINMTNTIDSTWSTDEPITNYGKGTNIYFKVFAVGQNNDTTETYRFQYEVRNGLNVNSVVENNFNYDVNLFPNPSNGQFNVDLGSSYDNVALRVFDVTGKEVYTKMASGSNLSVDMKAPKGSYFLWVVAGSKKAKIKFIIE
jgi:photosystem II stability/assembly factor-like uncharacterized protein